MSVPRPLSVFVIAGEPSGDALGGALLAGLRAEAGDLRLSGVGGAAMAAQGLQSLFPMDELSVMGLAEVLPKYRALKARIRQTAQAIADTAPDVVITIDSPDFCLRVLKLARTVRPALPCVHYVAPSVWAWRPGRAARMAPLVDHVLALLPFEPPYMQAVGMSCDFVGHPVVAVPQATADDAAAFRARLGMAPGAPLVLALPGSRAGEIARLAPRFGSALAQAFGGREGLRVVVPTVPAQLDRLRAEVARWPVAADVLDPTDAQAKAAAFRAADVALAASGTVSLELAASDTPMVIAHDMHPLSRLIIRALLRIDTVTLVNLVSDTRAVPEFLGTDCRPDRIAPALRRLLDDPGAADAQRRAMAATMERLGRGGAPPGVRAARSVLAFLQARPGRAA